MGDTSRGIQVIGNSIIDSDNRWITIHVSNGITVRNNVGYNSIGHGFFLEDGLEIDNVFENNIGIKTSIGHLITSDTRSAIFWISNPYNVFRNNVAVGGFYYGFHMDIPFKKMEIPDLGGEFNLRSLPTQIFEDNLSYDNRHAGLKVDRITVKDTNIESSELVISKFRLWGDPTKKINQQGIIIKGDDVTVSDSKIYDSKIGIELAGDRITVRNMEIKGSYQDEFEPLITGVLVAGKDNIIIDSVIEGYVSKNDRASSDISLSNYYFHDKILSAKIINTKLLDKKPIIFGYPINEQSFLEVYGYDAPNAPTKKYPKDFVLKRVDSSYLTDVKKEPMIDENFIALVEPLGESAKAPAASKNSDIQDDDQDLVASKIISDFKITASLWSSDIVGSDEFFDGVRILLDSQIIYLPRDGLDNFESNDLELPNWFKFVTDLWIENKISDQEFTNALTYIIKLQIENAMELYN